MRARVSYRILTGGGGEQCRCMQRVHARISAPARNSGHI